jgi:ATPase subunit of ABC transporter with duplicated ATPase domains
VRWPESRHRELAWSSAADRLARAAAAHCRCPCFAVDAATSVIRLDQISKQHGPQILFVEASAAIQRGEKVGLVGPNGAGKSTIFRLITREESPDDGQVSVDRGLTIGYFSQDVGEMAGRSAVAEVMDGAGPVAAVAAELKELEHALADPDRADEMEDIIAQYGEVQHRFEELDGYALEGRAREVLAGLSFSPEMMDGDVGALSGGWKMRVALMSCCSTSRATISILKA